LLGLEDLAVERVALTAAGGKIVQLVHRRSGCGPVHALRGGVDDG
jgi:hypothetical protein